MWCSAYNGTHRVTIMASYREGRPRTSIAWEHFEIKDRLRSIATCNHCHESFSYRTSVSNLMKHLRLKHGFVKEDEINEIADTAEDKTDAKKILKSELWQHYEIKDEFLKLATCNLCHEPFSYQNCSVLVKHLKKKHDVECLVGSDEDQSDEDSNEEKHDASQNGTNDNADRRRNRSSAAWEYFEIKDPHKKIAACTVCGAKCSYRASVSNLTKHARRKHGLGPFRSSSMDKSDGEQEASDVEQNNPAPPTGTVMRAQRSIVWLYFKCVDPESKYSRCLICKKILSHSTTLTNLKKHLARKHPDVKIPEREDGRKRILLSSGGELYEVETNSKLDDDEILAHDDDTQHDQTVEMDTVYLEDFDALDTTPLKKKQRQAKAEKTKIPEFESSSEDEITFSNKFTKKKCDSLDHFGKYLVSLLRNLPRETSNTLQADFVKQIMSVQTSDAPITATDTYSTVTDIFDQKGDKIN